MNLKSFPQELIESLAELFEATEDHTLDTINEMPFGSKANLFAGGYVNAIGTDDRLVITEIHERGYDLIERCKQEMIATCRFHHFEYRPAATLNEDDFCPGCRDEAMAERVWDQ